MKKTIFFLFTALFSISHAQSTTWCATDRMQDILEIQNPAAKKAKQEAESRLLNEGALNYLNKMGVKFDQTNKKVGEIYEIPVVVHVIVPTGSVVGTDFNKTDAQITEWIENANKMYATTYGNEYFPSGNGNNDGTIIPVKLVLAKRNAQCLPTTGIVRYDGGSIPGYDDNGVRVNTVGVSQDQIKTLAPHWPEASYFNIYIVNKIDGGGLMGIMGWCGYPSNPDSSYDSFMKSYVVTSQGDNTLAHEFGHGMALIHPFNPANSSGGECPINNDCQQDNDKVCDTPPTQSQLGVFPIPSNLDINPCTTQPYEGVQYNIMNYGSKPRKFTPGQRDRAVAMFLSLRSSLTTSLGGTAIGGGPAVGSSLLIPAGCNPSEVVNKGNYGIGPVLVTLGTINNASDANSTNFYTDYTIQKCLSNRIAPAELVLSAAQNIQVKTSGSYSQSIRVWIDYNNNGTFETSELVATGDNVSSGTWSKMFTAPSNAVINTALRMRVKADVNLFTNNTCAQLSYGQVEDYAVIFKSSVLGTSDVRAENKTFSIYPNPAKEGNFSVRLNSADKKAEIEITDVSGRVVFKKEITGNEGEFKVNSKLSSGLYFIKIMLAGHLYTEKLIIE